MHDNLRVDLEALLEKYAAENPAEQAIVSAYRFLLASPGDPFSRHSHRGHVTASALVAAPDLDRLMLIHHQKLDLWIQPGGHVERASDETTAHAALREVREESGIDQLTLLRPEIFDLDIHEIPARGNVPAHLHFDVRYLVQAGTTSTSLQEDEIKGLRWDTPEEIANGFGDVSMVRMANKFMKWRTTSRVKVP